MFDCRSNLKVLSYFIARVYFGVQISVGLGGGFYAYREFFVQQTKLFTFQVALER